MSNPDLDGVSYVVFIRLFDIPHDSIVIEDYTHVETDNFSDYIAGFDEIFYVDYAPDKVFYERLISEGKTVWVFDHHDRSLELEGDHIYVDLEECGTSLFWENYVKPNYVVEEKPIYQQFVDLVKTYDLWKQDSPLWEEAKALNSVCYSLHDYRAKSAIWSFYPYYDAQERKLRHWQEWDWTLPEKQAAQKAIDRENEMFEEAEKNLQFRTDTRDVPFGVTQIPSKISLVASRLLEKYSEKMQYIILVNTFKGISGKCSARSKGFPCRSLQLPDGHEEAAGFVTRPEWIEEFLEGKKWSLAYQDEPTRTGFRLKD